MGRLASCGSSEHDAWLIGGLRSLRRRLMRRSWFERITTAHIHFPMQQCFIHVEACGMLQLLRAAGIRVVTATQRQASITGCLLTSGFRTWW